MRESAGEESPILERARSSDVGLDGGLSPGGESTNGFPSTGERRHVDMIERRVQSVMRRQPPGDLVVRFDDLERLIEPPRGGEREQAVLIDQRDVIRVGQLRNQRHPPSAPCQGPLVVPSGERGTIDGIERERPQLYVVELVGDPQRFLCSVVGVLGLRKSVRDQRLCPRGGPWAGQLERSFGPAFDEPRIGPAYPHASPQCGLERQVRVHVR